MTAFFSDPGYTGDGFTDEHDDGWPANAHPDEVEHDRLRTTYPDILPFGEEDDADLDDDTLLTPHDEGYDPAEFDDDDYDDDGYYVPNLWPGDYDGDDDLDEDSDYFDFYTEAEDIIEGETYGRYIGPGSDTLPESAGDGQLQAPFGSGFHCDGCEQLVPTLCEKCFRGECCCTCGKETGNGGIPEPTPDEPPPGRWGMPLTSYILL